MTPGGSLHCRCLRNVFERRRAEGSGGERATRLGSRGGSQLADVSSSPPNYPRAILYSRLTPPLPFFPSLALILSRGSCHLGMKGGSSSIARRLTSGVAPNSRRRLSLPNYATASREGVLPPPPPPGLHPHPHECLISQSFSYLGFLFKAALSALALQPRRRARGRRREQNEEPAVCSSGRRRCRPGCVTSRRGPSRSLAMALGLRGLQGLGSNRGVR